MGQPLTKFYGTFRDGKLVAYMYTEGNDSFQAFHARASDRINTYSPQEFLDLAVARDFVRRGVRIFDRGYLNIRAGMIGLLEYKKKFGDIHGRFEVNWNNISHVDTPENHYLNELFANKDE